MDLTKEDEVKYISEPANIVQKLFNQWKYQFSIKIIHMEFDKSLNGTIYINVLISRRKTR